MPHQEVVNLLQTQDGGMLIKRPFVENTDSLEVHVGFKEPEWEEFL